MRGISEVIDCGRRCQVVVRTPYLLFFPSPPTPYWSHFFVAGPAV
ncbi:MULTISPECIES: hypothetical protein [Thermogemmatispora]|nr:MULTISPECIES: hypothetical protein [Thermogemmatispora]